MEYLILDTGYYPPTGGTKYTVMQPQTPNDYAALLSDVIKKQIIILGPDITLIKARNVPGLVVADDGTVTQITGEPQMITQNLIDQFVQLSGLIVKKTMEPLLAYHAMPIPTIPVTPIPIQAAPNITPLPTIPPQPQSQPVAPQEPQPTGPIVDNTSPNMQHVIDEALQQQ